MTRIYDAAEYKEDEDDRHELYFRVSPKEAKDLADAIRRDKSFILRTENYKITVYIED